ncbi:hypothetical protein MVEN_00023000 [Mycena venus]|uniref:Uncharacterized protein n=1 Tax=Mycena venus TaxID=2733690 RepID=A0A8H6Z648_9AGAR|nr:hypothetical protein MVEN_00023000 [Mycena venus]
MDDEHSNPDENNYEDQSLSTESRVDNVQTTPAKRSLEDLTFGMHENTTTQMWSDAQQQDELALRRPILDEKAQLIEMHRLGVFTKEEFIARLEKIEAHCEEVATRPTLAKRPRLSN